MDLSFLDKSSGVTPLLVRLYDSHKLYGLAKDKKPLARAELTSAVSELLEMKLSPRESELIADVLITLMRQAELELRQALAERLSVVNNVPLRLILQIANDEISVAAPVLRNSVILGDLDLIYIIKSKSAEYWRAIAAREHINAQVMNLLADTGDFETALTLAKNKNIALTEHVLGVLSDLAQGNEVLAQPLLMRDEITTEIAGKLYEFVGKELKKYILDHYDLDRAILVDAIDDVVLELSDVTIKASEPKFMPPSSDLKSADRFKEKGLLTVNLMLGTLKRGQVQSFVAQFSRYTGLKSETVVEILCQPSGQGLAVACKAHGIMKPDFISIYLLTNRTRKNGATMEVNDMTRALHYFDNIRPEIAEEIMKNSMMGDKNNKK